MPYMDLDEDPSVPQGSVLNAEIVVTQYFDPQGKLRFRCYCDGGVPLSGLLGMLELAKVSFIEGCTEDEDDDN